MVDVFTIDLTSIRESYINNCKGYRTHSEEADLSFILGIPISKLPDIETKEVSLKGYIGYTRAQIKWTIEVCKIRNTHGRIIITNKGRKALEFNF